MPEGISTRDLAHLKEHFSDKFDKEQREKFLKLFNDTKQNPHIVLEMLKNGELRKEYIKAYQHKESKDLYYIAISKDERDITGIPTTQIQKVINDIARSERVIKEAENLEGISNTAAPFKNETSPQRSNESIAQNEAEKTFFERYPNLEDYDKKVRSEIDWGHSLTKKDVMYHDMGIYYDNITPFNYKLIDIMQNVRPLIRLDEQNKIIDEYYKKYHKMDFTNKLKEKIYRYVHKNEGSIDEIGEFILNTQKELVAYMKKIIPQETRLSYEKIIEERGLLTIYKEKIEKVNSLFKEANAKEEIKQIIDNGVKKGRDMQILGEENFTPEVVEYIHKSKAKAAIDKLEKDEAENLGFKYSDDVRLTIDSEAIQHTLKRHGAESDLVKNSGQIPVEYKDIAEYRNIVKNADESLRTRDNAGNDVIVSYRQINGYAVVVEQIRKKNNELSFKTMFKQNGDYKNSKSYKETSALNQTLSIGYEPSANSFSKAEAPQKADSESIAENEAKKSLFESSENFYDYNKKLLREISIEGLDKQNAKDKLYFNTIQTYMEKLGNFEKELSNIVQEVRPSLSLNQKDKIIDKLYRQRDKKDFRNSLKELVYFYVHKDKLGIDDIHKVTMDYVESMAKYVKGLLPYDNHPSFEKLVKEKELFDEVIRQENKPSVKPLDEFGVNFEGFKGKEAVDKLLSEKRGQVKGAFYKEGLGEIDLVWGDENFGLRHILNKHGDEFEDIAAELSEAMEKGVLKKQNEVRSRIEFKDFVIGLSGEFKGEKRAFIITAFKRNGKSSTLSPKQDFTDKSDNVLSNQEDIIPQNSEKLPFETQTLDEDKLSGDEVRLLANKIGEKSTMAYFKDYLLKMDKNFHARAKDIIREYYKIEPFRKELENQWENVKEAYKNGEMSLKEFKFLSKYKDEKSFLNQVAGVLWLQNDELIKNRGYTINKYGLTEQGKGDNYYQNLALEYGKAQTALKKWFYYIQKANKQAQRFFNKKELDDLRANEKGTKLEAKGSEDIIFTDKKGKEHTLTKETQKAWLEAFGLKSLEDSYIPNHNEAIKQALEGKEIKLQLGSLKKLVAQGREKYMPQIKEVLDRPEAIMRDDMGEYLFIKHLKDDDYFVNVSFDNGEYLVSISNGIKETRNLNNKLKKGGEFIYQSPNFNFISQKLLQTSQYSANKIDEDIIAQNAKEQSLFNDIIQENEGGNHNAKQNQRNEFERVERTMQNDTGGTLFKGELDKEKSHDKRGASGGSVIHSTRDELTAPQILQESDTKNSKRGSTGASGRGYTAGEENKKSIRMDDSKRSEQISTDENHLRENNTGSYDNERYKQANNVQSSGRLYKKPIRSNGGLDNRNLPQQILNKKWSEALEKRGILSPLQNAQKEAKKEQATQKYTFTESANEKQILEDNYKALEGLLNLEKIRKYEIEREKIEAKYSKAEYFSQADEEAITKHREKVEHLDGKALMKLLANFKGFGKATNALLKLKGEEKAKWDNMLKDLSKALRVKINIADLVQRSKDAYYTPDKIIEKMVKLVDDFAKNANKDLYDLYKLEPSAGIGRFFNHLPIANSYAVEKDRLSAKMSEYLYEGLKVDNSGYENSYFKLENQFDLVIGNPPYANFKIGDDTFKENIHNYFMKKNVDNLRADGISLQIITHNFMDAKNPYTRDLIAKDAEFLGAVRLPNTTFKDASVTTDIIAFRKRNAKDKDFDTSWAKSVEIEKDVWVNQYFLDNPQNVLGKMEVVNSQFGRAIAVKNENFDLDSLNLSDFIKSDKAFKSKFDFDPNSAIYNAQYELYKRSEGVSFFQSARGGVSLDMMKQMGVL
ncbi:TPA: Eco57I restriction-modification methylase domain-containing protein [Campylobacter upsaliensis]|nr:Eco57I restriction-modification methylase domain-containing protein [Campylobacter upsaliensis]